MGLKVGLFGLEKRVGEVALYSIALREAKSKWADGTSDDPPLLFRPVRLSVLTGFT